MNDYELRQEHRRQRLLDAAQKASAEADARFQRAHDATADIPFGQPILVGHHSEGRHRAAIKRMEQNMNAGCAAADRARELEFRAAGVGSAGISSDDPQAIEKLAGKLAELEAQQARLKALNAAHKKYLKDPASLEKSGLSEADQERCRSYVPRYSWEPHPAAPFELTNLSANIRRVRERIQSLEREAATRETAQEPQTRQHDGLTIREDPDENRLLIEFDAIPAPEVRELLKRHGFRWSPTRKAWTRMLNNAARHAVECQLLPAIEKATA